jgi:DNA-binding XRE family transcriptional regulator
MPAKKGNTYAKGNPGGGRKSGYEKKYADMAYKIALLGATDKDLAEIFEVSEQTINTWKKKHKEFSLSLKKGKDMADAEVADKLFKRATGYSHPDVDIKVIRNKIVPTKLVKHYPPDTTAAIFWLKNRQKDKWRDKVETGVTDKDGNDVKPFTDEQADKFIEAINKLK